MIRSDLRSFTFDEDFRRILLRELEREVRKPEYRKILVPFIMKFFAYRGGAQARLRQRDRDFLIQMVEEYSDFEQREAMAEKMKERMIAKVNANLSPSYLPNYIIEDEDGPIDWEKITTREKPSIEDFKADPAKFADALVDGLAPLKREMIEKVSKKLAMYGIDPELPAEPKVLIDDKEPPKFEFLGVRAVASEVLSEEDCMEEDESGVLNIKPGVRRIRL